MDDVEQLIEGARTARNRGDLAGALAGYEAAVALLRGLEIPLRLAHTIRHVADIQSELGQLDAARMAYGEALALYRNHLATGVLDLANTLRGYALLMQRLGDGGAAREMWAEARTLYRAINVRDGVKEADRQLGLLGPP